MRRAVRAVLPAVLLAACSYPESGGDAPDARPTVDGPAADAPDTSPTPPPPCIALADEPDGCRECLAGPPLAIDASVCSQTVCARDPSCCATQWDQRCVQLADAHCEIDECLNTVAFTGGTASLVVAQWDGTTVVSDSWTSFPDQLIPGADWADYDGDGLADAVFASECFVKVLRGRGWSGDQLSMVTVFNEDLGCGSPGGAYGASARWADVDEDGDLDVVAGTDRTAFWIEQQGGQLTRASDLVPPGSAGLTAISVGDLDGDRHLDVTALVRRNQPGTDDFFQTLERFEYSPIDGFVADPDWGEEVYYHSAVSLRWCDLAGDSGRELMFGGQLSSWAHPIVEGTLDTDTVLRLDGRAGPVTCGNLVGDAKDEVVIAHQPDEGPMELLIIDDNVVIWRSSTNQPVPFTGEIGALEAIDLDDDGDLDLVVGGGTVGEVEGVVTVLRRQPGPGLSFTIEPVGDLLVGHDTQAAQVLHLPRRPPPAR